jgi:NAD(P)-dependent dehydrogenase (short-subunit alcohol dehydrogenase family)
MRNLERSSELRIVTGQESLPITILRLDVDRDDSVREAVRQVLAEQNRIDALVNNAGVATFGAVEDLPLAVFRETLETNSLGAIRCIQALLPPMREQRSGCIVNVTSVAGRIAIGGGGSYCASKFALEVLSEALAHEVKPYNIRVAIVEPGIIQTAIFDKLTDPLDTGYPFERRIRALFAAALRNPVAASVAGEAIRQIIEGDSWQLRYPVGPDAAPFLQWRAGMTDEEFADYWSTPDDETWYARIERDFGLNCRPFRHVRSVAQGI